MARELTLKQLQEAGACSDGLARFEELFGESVEITEDLCAEYALDDRLDFDWAGMYVLTGEPRRVFMLTTDASYAVYDAAVRVLVSLPSSSGAMLRTTISPLAEVRDREIAHAFCMAYNMEEIQ